MGGTRTRRAAAAALLVLAACTGSSGPDAGPAATKSPAGLATKPVKKDCTWEIATLAPKTSGGQTFARVIHPGLALAVKVANADSAVPCRLEVVSREVRGGDAEFFAAADAVGRRKKVIACLCGTTGREVTAVAARLEDERILVTSPISERVLPFSTWFRPTASDYAVADMTALYLKRALDASTVVTVRDELPAAGGLAGILEAAVGRGVRTTTVRNRAAFYAADARRIVKMRPDAVYVDTSFITALDFVPDLRKAGYEGPLLAGTGIMSPEYRLAGGAAKGTFTFCGCVDVTRHEPAADFLALHRRVYDEDPGPRAAEVFDVTTFMARALEKLNGNEPIAKVRKRVVAWFEKAKDVEGIAKTYTWDIGGDLLDVRDDVVVYEWDEAEETFVQVGTVEELLPDA